MNYKNKNLPVPDLASAASTEPPSEPESQSTEQCLTNALAHHPRAVSANQVERPAAPNERGTSSGRPSILKARLESNAVAASSCTVTVLTAVDAPMRKRFLLDDTGKVKSEPKANGFHFRHIGYPAACLEDLAQIIEHHSAGSSDILVRGRPLPQLPKAAERKGANMPEPSEGCFWAMFDFDDIPLPEGISTTERASLEHLVAKLPSCFADASYFFQFSSSAGILNPDDTPLKHGINAHIFFWLDRPVPGKDLAAFVRLHCIQTAFLEKTSSKDERPRIKYGIDESVLKSSVQPHFIALPVLETGVPCRLPPEDRQGLVLKARQSVQLPEINADTRRDAESRHQQLRDAWARECGFKSETSLTRLPGGPVGVSRVLARRDGTAPLMGRTFLEAKVIEKQGRDGKPVRFAALYFQGESSPGSWYVIDRSPVTARRHGDGEAIHLQELSDGAYRYVRDELKWFEGIEHRRLELTEPGYLRHLDSFIRARNTLLIAPTGSGKTSAFCDYVAARHRTEIIIYTAQTVALTRQMEQDLNGREIRNFHYQGKGRSFTMSPGVYITTNKSLGSFLQAVRRQGLDFSLVIDEAHMATDDFMRNDTQNRVLEDAVCRAKTTLMMTGTITPLQIKKVTETVSSATGALTPANFELCEFRPCKAYPLLWADTEQLDCDLIALMRSHQVLKEAGSPLPRVVIIVPTSKMKLYELMLKAFGLFEDAMVVSRDEATQEDIEAARTSSRPWLISSPLFALGLNFENAPDRLWTWFDHLSVDTSQIIQTVNRANRTGKPCEVRLYAGTMDPSPVQYLDADAERKRLEGFLLEESDVLGVIDPHFQLDRLTYNTCREKERVTAKSLHQLLAENSIQNYNIVTEWQDDLPHEPGDADLYSSFGVEARVSYNNDVVDCYLRVADEQPSLLLHRLGKLAEAKRDFRNPKLVPKVIGDQERATMAALAQSCQLARRNQPMESVVMRRLFAEAPPFLSAQYSEDRTTTGRDALAQKTRDILPIVDLLESLKKDGLTGIAFGKKMRLKGNRKGVLALAVGESDFLRWQRRIERLDTEAESLATASAVKRDQADKLFFEAAQAFLERIGIEFEKTMGPDRRWHKDPTKPLVPDWDFRRMRYDLECKAESILSRPSIRIDLDMEARRWPGVAVSLGVCRECCHCDLHGLCLLGRPVQWPGDVIEPSQADCDGFNKLSARVIRLREILQEPGNSQESWLVPCQSSKENKEPSALAVS